MINEQRWKMNYVGLLKARNISPENVNFGCQAISSGSVLRRNVCICEHIYVCVYTVVQNTHTHTHTDIHTHPHIFCKINTSLLFPITLLFACWNTDGFKHTVFPTLCVLHNQLSYTLFNKVNTGKVRLSSNVNCFHRFAVCFHIKS